MQHIIEEKVDLCAISEPAWIPTIPGWFDSIDGLALIYCNSNFKPNVIRSQSFVVVTIELFSLVSVYISPNVGLSAFLLLLHNIKDLVRKSNKGIMICGDFNAHATYWGSGTTNKRGTLLIDTMAELDMRLVNKGSISTCVRPQSESIIDLTWMSSDLVFNIDNWRVRDDLESLSDHLYISFSLYNKFLGNCNNINNNNNNIKNHIRWNHNKINSEDFTLSLEWNAATFSTERQNFNPTEFSDWLDEVMYNACSLSMPKIMTNSTKRQTFW